MNLLVYFLGFLKRYVEGIYAISPLWISLVFLLLIEPPGASQTLTEPPRASQGLPKHPGVSQDIPELPSDPQTIPDLPRVSPRTITRAKTLEKPKKTKKNEGSQPKP